MPDLALSLPCYNEAACLEQTATELAGAFASRGFVVNLVLVDNGSTDGTGAVIDRLIQRGLPVTKVTVPVNQGYGYGVLQGLAACDAPWVGFLCADGQVEAEDVVRLFDVAKDDGGEVLVKVRRRFRKDGLRRKVVSVAYNALTVVMFGGLNSIDVNGNPKIFPGAWLPRLGLVSRDWFLDPEVMLKVKKLGGRVVEVDVNARMRQGGRSNVGLRTCVEFARNLLAYRLSGPGVGS